MKAVNPFAFRPGPVTLWTTLIYLAVIIPLLYVQEVVPAVPSAKKIPTGVNLTEAWLDLQAITRSYHPYNSHENDVVRAYLMRRSREILDRNGIHHTTDLTGGIPWSDSLSLETVSIQDKTGRAPGATVFDDRVSNVSYALKGSPIGQYFEANNFYVYVHGKEDPEGEWWLSEQGTRAARQAAGVLVNCHFDSVSTGYGATDDGMSCISLLQMISHFTSEGNQPKNGIVFLFNNAEEDGLLGARAFGYSPLVKFCHTFVNLEGAGAGGRAMLFRTTDLESARAYSRSPHPFGSVVASNAFEKGAIKSDTDYSVFAPIFGQRGVDIAFYEPRSRYHTQDDDARHTSRESVWHMLSAALASTKSFSETTSADFNGPRADGRKDLVQSGRPTSGVWFDWFGNSWSAFPLRGLFAWTLTLLVVTPLALLVVTYLLIRQDKYYFFAKDIKSSDGETDLSVAIGGWKGFVRLPFALVVAGATTIASVYLVAKVNPLIIYSSGYAVWAMMISIFYFFSWLIMRGASFVRPSALQRGFAMMWLFAITWILSVVAAVAEDRMQIGAFYFLAFFHTAVFVGLLISLLELFSLPSKKDLAAHLGDEEEEEAEPSARDSAAGAQRENDDDEAEATETTPLRAGEEGYGANGETTFASTYRRSVSEARASEDNGKPAKSPYGREQAWSGRLPGWTWLIQLLLLAPVHVIVLGSLGLVQTTSMAQTGTDGSSLFVPLLAIGIISMFLLLPLTAFIHRVTHHLPLFLLLVCIGTLIYNLAAFPFSVNYRFKFKFQQVVDLDGGTNAVTLYGLEEYLRPVIDALPTATGQHIECEPDVAANQKACSYDATLLPPDLSKGTKLEDLVSLRANLSTDGRSVDVVVDGVNTRSCYIESSAPIYEFFVEGGSKHDYLQGEMPSDGLTSVQLWRRKWDGPWHVHLRLERDESDQTEKETVSELEIEELKRSVAGLNLTAKCVWSDANEKHNVPAFHEVIQYMPSWAVVTKRFMGLVVVQKSVHLL